MKLNSKKTIIGLSIAIFLAIVGFEISAQEKSTSLKDFEVVIERTENGINIKSIKGSAWKHLTFSIDQYQPQAIDEFGMTSFGKVSSKKDPKLADYLFTVIKTNNGIALKGIAGTAWTDLSFSLPLGNRQAIDQYGMTKLN